MKTIKELNQIAKNVANGQPLPKKLNTLETEIVQETAALINRTPSQAEQEVQKIQEIGLDFFN